MSCVHPGVITLPYANRRMSSLPQAVNRFSASFPPWQKCRLQPRTSTSSSVDYGGCNLHYFPRQYGLSAAHAQVGLKRSNIHYSVPD